jgi:hypothetical protein
VIERGRERELEGGCETGQDRARKREGEVEVVQG